MKNNYQLDDFCYEVPLELRVSLLAPVTRQKRVFLTKFQSDIWQRITSRIQRLNALHGRKSASLR